MFDELILVQEAHRPRADAIKNRAHLLDTARQLFDQNGVEAVTMRGRSRHHEPYCGSGGSG